MSEPIPEILRPDFKRTLRLRPKAIGGGLYKLGEGKSATFWERPKVGRCRTIRKLKARTEEAARLELARKRIAQADSQADPRIQDPYKRSDKLTVADIADFYLESACPKRDRRPRPQKQLLEEKRRAESIKEILGKRAWDSITLDDWTAYGNKRIKQVREKFSSGTRDGTRAVDLELATWGSMFRWAQRNPARTGVKFNPLAGERPILHHSSKIRHCRECQPSSGDELHLIASRFAQDDDSEVFTWQTLIEAFTGRRTNEVLKLRWDAKTKNEAGYIATKPVGRGCRRAEVPWRLYFHVPDSHKGVYPYIDITEPLRTVLDLLKQWRNTRYPNSPWFFPSPVDPSRTVDVGSLSKALRRVCAELGLALRTSHGLRSYHVNVLRSDRDQDGRPKLSDAEIALRIGHKSGGKLIVETYGDGDLSDRLSFLPEKQPLAWSKFIKGRPIQLDLGL